MTATHQTLTDILEVLRGLRQSALLAAQDTRDPYEQLCAKRTAVHLAAAVVGMAGLMETTMKFYRLDKRAEAGTSFGYEWFTNRHAAQKAFHEWMEEEDRGGTQIEEIEIAPTKDGVFRALHRFASHPDNG